MLQYIYHDVKCKQIQMTKYMNEFHDTHSVLTFYSREIVRYIFVCDLGEKRVTQ